MSHYDFSIEEYAKFLAEELSGTDIVPAGTDMAAKRGRRPKNDLVDPEEPEDEPVLPDIHIEDESLLPEPVA